MFVDVLTVAQRTPERQWSEMTSLPGWAEIEEALNHLDGDRSSLMTLNTDEGCMTIGGGQDGYLVCATFDLENYHQAVNPAACVESRELRVNGKPRACAGKSVVNRVVALRAARAFALDGRLEPSLLWEAC